MSLDTARNTLSLRDDFYVRAYVPGNNWTDQTAVSAITVGLTATNASTAGIVQFHDAASAGNVIVQTTIGAGASKTPTVYVGQPTTTGSYTVTAEMPAANAAVTSGTVTVTPGDLKLRFRPSNTTYTSATVGKGFRTLIVPGGYNEWYVDRLLNGVAYTPAEALTVTLTSSDPGKAGVPVTVTIPAGQSAVGVPITGVELTGGTPITLDATATNYTSPATKLPVNVVAPTLQFMSLDTARNTLSLRDDFYVRAYVPGNNWTDQTAVSAITVGLTATNASTAGIVQFHDAASAGNVIVQTTIGAGASKTPTVYVGQPTTTGSYTVTASIAATGSSVTSGTVTVNAADLRLNFRIGYYNGNSALTSAVVGKGLTTYRDSNDSAEVFVYRTLNGAAYTPVEPLTVSLACNAMTICSVPATVTIPANQYWAAIPVTGLSIGTTTITPVATSYTAAADLPVSVINSTFSFSGLVTSLTVNGLDAFTVNAYTPGAYYPSNQTAAASIPVTLVSAAPNVASVTPTVTVAAGATASGTAQVTALASGTTSITASATDFNPAVSANITVNP
jgi:trimeric autotransporter adhesin